MDSAQTRSRCEWIHLESLCRQTRRSFDAQLLQRSIRVSLDLDPAMWFTLPPDALRARLAWCLADAIQALPKGGEIDLVAMLTARGLEIEVADSSELDQRTVPGGDTFAAGAGDTSHAGDGIGLETRRCPQGGWARTIVVPQECLQQNQPTLRRAA